MSTNKIHINQDFKASLQMLNSGASPIFITGKAGTGKSTLLRYFSKKIDKKYVILAPTGIAALNVGGQTIHSFFGFPPRPLQRSEIKVRPYLQKLYKALELIIIDEISMVRADLLDNIDQFLRINRNRPYEPFGGVQMVFFGDLFQLPPVVSTTEEQQLFQLYYESPFFFSAHALRDAPLHFIELNQVYRQKNKNFIRLLDAVRLNHIDYDLLMDLNECYLSESEQKQKLEDYNYITLAARNSTVDQINKQKLQALKTEEHQYIAELTGDFKTAPAESPLKLKEGAQVMFIKNDPKKKYVNGTIGKIHKLEFKKIVVEVVDALGKVSYIKVSPQTWELNKYKLNTAGEIESVVVGTFKQYPLKLAWAMTIHKSQGKTFDYVHIDLGKGAFEDGQTYVALSRCTSKQGVLLKQAIKAQGVSTGVKSYNRMVILVTAWRKTRHKNMLTYYNKSNPQ